MEARRGRLTSIARADLDGHVKACDACKHEEAIDSVLDVALSKLTAEPPPSTGALKDARLPPLHTRLDAAHAGVRASVRRRMFWGLFGLTVLGLAVVLFPRGYVEADPLVREAVNDHVRLLTAKAPVEAAGDSLDKVTRELVGRLDFAPANGFGGDAETKLIGASVAYFIDRNAAAFIYQHETHTVTVLVFRADGLPWRGNGSRYAVTKQGYRAVLFRHADLGYAIVSELPEAALISIAAKVDSL